MKHKYSTNVTNGKIQKNVSLLIKQTLTEFEGKGIVITIEKKKSTRSAEQNSLYFLYVEILAKELGYTKDEMHEIIKFKFNRKHKVNEKTGEVLEYIGSTTSLSVSEFTEYLDSLRIWASEMFNVYLPLPDEQLEIE